MSARFFWYNLSEHIGGRKSDSHALKEGGKVCTAPVPNIARARMLISVEIVAIASKIYDSAQAARALNPENGQAAEK